MISRARLRLTLRVRRGRLELGPFAGNTLRGAFGHALRAEACRCGPDTACAACPLRRDCPYVRIFEPKADLFDAAGDLRCDDLPRPFILDTREADDRSFAVDQTFRFQIALVGPAVAQTVLVLRSFLRAGLNGIGEERIPCALGAVEVETDGAWRQWAGGGVPAASGCDAAAALRACATAHGAEAAVRIQFQTPFRFRFEGTMLGALPFHVLARNLLRRLSLMETCYGDGHVDIDYRDAVEAAEKVPVLVASLERERQRRISSRQERSISMSGLVGAVDYRLAVDRWLPLLECGAVLHVGRGAAFGLGKYEVARLAEAPGAPA